MIDVAAVFSALKEAVDEKGGEYVSEGSQYVHYDNQPCCLVGTAAYYLGLPLPKYNSYKNYRTVPTVATELGWDIEPRALGILAAAQREQDNGASWGEALAEAAVANFSGALA